MMTVMISIVTEMTVVLFIGKKKGTMGFGIIMILSRECGIKNCQIWG